MNGLNATLEYFEAQNQDINWSTLVAVFQNEIAQYAQHLLIEREADVLIIKSPGWYILKYERIPMERSIFDDYSDVDTEKMYLESYFFFNGRLEDGLPQRKDIKGKTHDLLWSDRDINGVRNQGSTKDFAICEIAYDYDGSLGVMGFMPLL